MLFLYEISLWILALLSIPGFLYQMAVKGKYRDSFLKRFGAQFPKIVKDGRPIVWIHAGSVGETKAVIALAKLIKAELNAQLIISSVTETGHAEAKRSLPFADAHVYLPFDFACLVKKIVKPIAPNLVILAESDFWFNFLRTCKESGAKIALVNGKVSERSTARFKKASFFTDKLLGTIDLFGIQSVTYQSRFLDMGVSPKKMVVTGNLKFDDVVIMQSDAEMASWKEQLGIGRSDPVLVVGSTHDPEEKIAISTLQEVWKSYPQLKALVVPRHPERFSEVANLFTKADIPFIRYSELHNKKGDERVILMDTMGILKKAYQLATVAIVGGSYTEKVGGHNILEPCGYGVPVLFGPYMHSQPELVALVKDYNAGLQVSSEALPSTIIELLESSEKRIAFGQRGKQLMQEMQGATARTWSAIRTTCLKK